MAKDCKAARAGPNARRGFVDMFWFFISLFLICLIIVFALPTAPWLQATRLEFQFSQAHFLMPGFGLKRISWDEKLCSAPNAARRRPK
jgi:hypothetical protein